MCNPAYEIGASHTFTTPFRLRGLDQNDENRICADRATAYGELKFLSQPLTDVVGVRLLLCMADSVRERGKFSTMLIL